MRSNGVFLIWKDSFFVHSKFKSFYRGISGISKIMEPIIPLTLHHVITHLLSKKEMNQYQDKDAVSLCGFKEFLLIKCFFRQTANLGEMMRCHDIISDKRGCPSYVDFEDIHCAADDEIDEEVLKMRSCVFLNFTDEHNIINSQELELFNLEGESTTSDILINRKGDSDLSQNENEEEDGYDDVLDEMYELFRSYEICAEGHVIAYNDQGENLSNDLLKFLSQFPYLKGILTFYGEEKYLESAEDISILPSFSNFQMLSSTLLSLWIIFKPKTKDSLPQNILSDIQFASKLRFLNLDSCATFGNIEG